MKQALKNFGLGLVYFFLLPIFLVFIALAGVFALGVMVINVFNGLIRFFKGDKFFEPLPEDIRVQEIKDYRASLQTAPATPPQQQQPESHVYIQQNYYQQPSSQNIPPIQNPQVQPQVNQNPQMNQSPMMEAQFVEHPQQYQQQPQPQQHPQINTQPANNPPYINSIDISNDDQGGDGL